MRRTNDKTQTQPLCMQNTAPSTNIHVHVRQYICIHVHQHVCMLSEVCVSAGTVLGVFFNAIAPGWAISILLVLTLIYTTVRA